MKTSRQTQRILFQLANTIFKKFDWHIWDGKWSYWSFRKDPYTVVKKDGYPP